MPSRLEKAQNEYKLRRLEAASSTSLIAPWTKSYWKKKFFIKTFIQTLMVEKGFLIDLFNKLIRNCKFLELDQLKIRYILWLSVLCDPTQHISDYLIILKNQGIECSSWVVRKVFQEWRWSWKKPCYKQLNKFTSSNIEYYRTFQLWISFQDKRKLKFMDEVHFMSASNFFLIILFII